MTEKSWEKTWGSLEEGSFWNEDVSIDALQAILDAGADVNAQNKYGSTPLHRAVEIGRLDIIDFLLKNGCEPSLNSALARAANCGRTEAAERLLEAGADPNYKYTVNGWNKSVLSNAAESEPEERRKLVQLLLEHGAVPTKEDIRAFGPCDDDVLHHMLRHPDLYRKKKDNEVLDWIREHPEPSVKDFLAPLGDKGESVIIQLVRAGSRVLEMVFPLQKWANLESRDDLQKIFADVPREGKLLETMRDFDDKLRTTYNYNSRWEYRQKRANLADMLLAIDDPKMRQEMDAKMRQKWGWAKRTFKKGSKEV